MAGHLRRLSPPQREGVAGGVAALTEAEALLAGVVLDVQAAAKKEAAVRRARGLPGPGPYGVALGSLRRVAVVLGVGLADLGDVLDRDEKSRAAAGLTAKVYPASVSADRPAAI